MALALVEGGWLFDFDEGCGGGTQRKVRLMLELIYHTARV